MPKICMYKSPRESVIGERLGQSKWLRRMYYVAILHNVGVMSKGGRWLHMRGLTEDVVSTSSLTLCLFSCVPHTP